METKRTRFKFNIKTIQKHRREYDEYARPSLAIRNHCLECMGYAQREECTARKCWLFPLRHGKPRIDMPESLIPVAQPLK